MLLQPYHIPSMGCTASSNNRPTRLQPRHHRRRSTKQHAETFSNVGSAKHSEVAPSVAGDAPADCSAAQHEIPQEPATPAAQDAARLPPGGSPRQSSTGHLAPGSVRHRPPSVGDAQRRFAQGQIDPEEYISVLISQPQRGRRQGSTSRSSSMRNNSNSIMSNPLAHDAAASRSVSLELPRALSENTPKPKKRTVCFGDSVLLPQRAVSDPSPGAAAQLLCGEPPSVDMQLRASNDSIGLLLPDAPPPPAAGTATDC